jgi:hypothetical protein
MAVKQRGLHFAGRFASFHETQFCALGNNLWQRISQPNSLELWAKEVHRLPLWLTSATGSDFEPRWRVDS